MKTKADQEWDERVARDFPVEVLAPWKARVATEVPGWSASLAPKFTWRDTDVPEYRLDQSGEPDRVAVWEPGRTRFHVTLTGTDQDELVRLAQGFAAPRPR